MSLNNILLSGTQYVETVVNRVCSAVVTLAYLFKVFFQQLNCRWSLLPVVDLHNVYFNSTQ